MTTLTIQMPQEETDEFVQKIKKAKENYTNGNYITIKNPDDIWESILSE